jgi:hypothetical protein
MGRLNAMVKSLCELHSTETVAIYTLNYDSLLMSALLEHAPWVYDGFRGHSVILSISGSTKVLDSWDSIRGQEAAVDALVQHALCAARRPVAAARTPAARATAATSRTPLDQVTSAAGLG